MLRRLVLTLATIVIALGAALYPRLRGFGLFRGPITLNNEDCVNVKGSYHIFFFQVLALFNRHFVSM